MRTQQTDESVEATFARALADLWQRDRIVAGECGPLARFIATSAASGTEGVTAARRTLERSGARDRWNTVLRCRRSALLAGRIHPLVSEPLVDVLCGDGSLCHALSEAGVQKIAATERIGDYPTSYLPAHVTFHPFSEDLDFARFGASTALLSTVLHHEPDPGRLLDALAAAGVAQWIVVENCVTPVFSHAFHRLADRFFNSCLNDFGAPCVEQHRTTDEWTKLLSSYGSVTVVEDGFAVPGIPFPYTLFVVRRAS